MIKKVELLWVKGIRLGEDFIKRKWFFLIVLKVDIVFFSYFLNYLVCVDLVIDSDVMFILSYYFVL